MRIQAFIFNWPGERQHAAKLEKMLRRHCEVLVVNSDDALRDRYPHWHHIGNEGYFTDQWNAALERFNADIMLHVQADVWPKKLMPMLKECVRQMRDFAVGVYAPDIDFTEHVFHRELLPRVDTGVYEVPTTDNSFWAISANVLSHVPPVHPEANRFGWGVDYLVSAVARLQRQKVVRDYRFRADHPKARNYNSQQAFRQWKQWKEGLDPEIRNTMNALEVERDRVVLLNPSESPIRSLFNRFASAAQLVRSRLSGEVGEQAK